MNNDPPLKIVPAVASLDAAREKINAPASQAEIVQRLEELLEMARAGRVYALGYTAALMPVPWNSTWDVKTGFLGMGDAPYSLLGGAVHLASTMERAISGLPTDADDVHRS